MDSKNLELLVKIKNAINTGQIGADDVAFEDISELVLIFFIKRKRKSRDFLFLPFRTYLTAPFVWDEVGVK